jgi:hypothetical protein
LKSPHLARYREHATDLAADWATERAGVVTHGEQLTHAVLPGSVDPGLEVGGIEAEEVAPLDVGNAAFVDEAADVADLDAEALGDGGDVDEVAGGAGLGQGLAPGVSMVFFNPPAKRVSATKCDRVSRDFFAIQPMRALVVC